MDSYRQLIVYKGRHYTVPGLRGCVNLCYQPLVLIHHQIFGINAKIGVRGALSWNKLPQDNRLATSVKSFVANLTKLLEEKYDFNRD